MKTLIIWFLVSQAIILTGNSAPRGGVGFSIHIKNEMHNSKIPSPVYYRCRSKSLPKKIDIGWHNSTPSSDFKWSFKVPSYGNGMMVHKCWFRSSCAGTAEIKIKTLSTTAILCGGQVCKYAIRPNGIYFIGNELYSPFGIGFIELSRPVEKLVDPWEPWSPHQTEILKHNKRHDWYKIKV